MQLQQQKPSPINLLSKPASFRSSHNKLEMICTISKDWNKSLLSIYSPLIRLLLAEDKSHTSFWTKIVQLDLILEETQRHVLTVNQSSPHQPTSLAVIAVPSLNCNRSLIPPTPNKHGFIGILSLESHVDELMPSWPASNTSALCTLLLNKH